MRRIQFLITVCLFIQISSSAIKAQSSDRQPSGRDVSLNRLITFSGTLRDSSGQPRLGSSGITFTLYATQEGGEALWHESQTVQTDEQGQYTILLGSTEKEGLPLDVFSSGKAQWLGVQVQGEEAEQPRVLLVAVPYALKAADADTVGGKPLSSFVLYEDLAKVQQAGTSYIVATERGSASSSGRQAAVQKANQQLLGGGPLLARAGRIGPFYGNEVGTNTYYGEGAANLSMTGPMNSFFGYYAGHANTTGSENTFVGYEAGQKGTDSKYNAFLGAYAGISTMSDYGSFFGYAAGYSNTMGTNNVFVGSYAGFTNTTGSDNSYFGYLAGLLAGGNSNSFFGNGVGYRNTANENSFFGMESGYSNTSAAGNAFFGFRSGYANQTGAANSFFGYKAGISNTGASNSLFGNSAGYTNTTGQNNTFIGKEAGYSNSAGSNNVFFGLRAGYQNTANENSFYGAESGYNNTSATGNAFFGFQAGRANQTGNFNSFFGHKAGVNTTGNQNSFFGYNSGLDNTSGYSNSFFGYQAGAKTNTGAGNSFYGWRTGYFNTGGIYNSIYGWQAGFYNTGSRNTFIGADASVNNTAGEYITSVGYLAGDSNTVENNNSFFGAYCVGSSGISNATAIGYRAQVTRSNSLVLGSINTVNGATADTKVGIGTTAPVSAFNVRSMTNVSPRGVTNEQYNEGMDGVQFRGRKARGTLDSPATVQSGDVLGNYVFDGHDGTAFGTGVQIRPVTEEAWTTTAHGAYLALWTTPPGSTTNMERLRITGAGNVGIGTTSPTERLHVVGSIRATGSIYSQLAPETEVPDFVFESDYHLMPIQELEKYIAQEKHLPNVPKASEIKENGLNHSEFQMRLLEKIEELTLYTVQQAKTIEQHKSALHQKDIEIVALKSQKDAEVAALRSQNAAFDSRLAALEQMMERLAKAR